VNSQVATASLFKAMASYGDPQHVWPATNDKTTACDARNSAGPFAMFDYDEARHKNRDCCAPAYVTARLAPISNGKMTEELRDENHRSKRIVRFCSQDG
jgi:hypothetical protein